MAVKRDPQPFKAEDADVSNCVSNLIQAFTNGLNIFKRLRERRRKRKARKENQVVDPTTSAELQLSKSLRKGPGELAERYAECYHSGIGPRFAKGDSIAHASLAETLIKLNTGLVSIIASFLNHDHKSGKGHLDLDYKSLTNLSDASRREALHSMTQLYQRLSYSQLQLYNIGSSCPRCGSAKHVECSSRSASPEKEKKKHTSSRQRISGPVVTKMPIKSSSQPQLVVMRPKNTRKSSNSSNSSGSTKSTSTSAYTSPLASPLPKYVPIDPLELQTSGVVKGTLGAWPDSGRRRVDSFDDPRPTTWPHTSVNAAPDHLHHHHHHHHTPTPKLPSFTPTPRKNSPNSPQRNKPSSPPPTSPSPVKRRLDKATPSSYTFASDSTKLGEIPQHHWTSPWDYEEAGRLNAEAAVIGLPTIPVADNKSKKKGRFGFLRRGSAAGQAA